MKREKTIKNIFGLGLGGGSSVTVETLSVTVVRPQKV